MQRESKKLDPRSNGPITHAISIRFAYVVAEPRRLRRKLKPRNPPQPVWFRPF